MPHILKPRRAALALAVLASLTFAPAATAAIPAELRVEGTGKTLDPGTTYLTGTESLPGAGDTSCAPISDRYRVPGATALGILGSAFESNRRLRPLGVAEDEFGLRVCRIGDFKEVDSPFSGWLYRVNHASPPTGAALHELEPGDEVLWYFANFGSGINTGDELVLRVPARARPGEVEVSVIAIAFDGTRKPAPDGTVIVGGGSPVSVSGGTATVELTTGRHLLRARHRPDITSAARSICVAAELGDCPAARGERIVGTAAADRIAGTAGPDRIVARGGADRVIGGAGADRVDCGPGRDTVVLGRGDIARNCEVRVQS